MSSPAGTPGRGGSTARGSSPSSTRGAAAPPAVAPKPSAAGSADRGRGAPAPSRGTNLDRGRRGGSGVRGAGPGPGGPGTIRGRGAAAAPRVASPPQEAPSGHMTVAVVGEPNVGKSCLVISYALSAFPGEYIPTTEPDTEIKADKTIDGKLISVAFIDMPGGSAFAAARTTETYARAAVVILAYSVVDRASLEAAEGTWHAEITARAPPGTPVVLVGLKSDLLDDANGGSAERGHVTTEEANAAAGRMGVAAHHGGVSCLTQAGMEAMMADVWRWAQRS